tara:strand:+ start:2364 stop:3230 length:867 start_codon:yes stop_codon:yes gene_type:complete
MSYYSSKHPGLFLYMALVTISVFSFLFIDMGSAHIGFLAILWGTYTALRTLTLYEMSEHYEAYAKNDVVSKNHNGQASALAYDLMHRMSAGRNMKRGMLALYCLHDRTILWFVLALFYTAFQLHISTPVVSKVALMETMCTLFMIGAAFWAGQSYAYSAKISRMLAGLFTALLCLSLVTLHSGLSLNALYPALSDTSLIDIGNPNTILVLLALYSTAILLFALVQKNRSTGNILVGIALVVLLTVCHIILEPSREATALWISGWGLFSIFWIRAYGTREKKYVLYQCE